MSLPSNRSPTNAVKVRRMGTGSQVQSCQRKVPWLVIINETAPNHEECLGECKRAKGKVCGATSCLPAANGAEYGKASQIANEAASKDLSDDPILGTSTAEQIEQSKNIPFGENKTGARTSLRVEDNWMRLGGDVCWLATCRP